jgi:putative membrane protein
MERKIIGTLAAALGLALAADARAQVGTSAEDVIREQQRRQQQQPGAQPAPPAQPGAQATAPVTDTQRQLFERLHARTTQVHEYGQLGETKGTSPRVKELGAKLRQDSERIEGELRQLAQERGIQLRDPTQIVQEQGHRAGVESLRALPPEQFDRQYAQATAQARTAEVDELKALRDATPGSDARLKKWLDDVENTMEEHRNLSRAVSSEVQRQGRRP